MARNTKDSKKLRKFTGKYRNVRLTIKETEDGDWRWFVRAHTGQALTAKRAKFAAEECIDNKIHEIRIELPSSVYNKLKYIAEDVYKTPLELFAEDLLIKYAEHKEKRGRNGKR